MESSLHLRLKRLALARLLLDGCCAGALEARCPIARFRVDVAAFADPLPKRARLTPSTNQCPDALINRGKAATTVIIECKQSRADFLSDARDANRLIDERAHLDQVRRALEERIVKVCEPHLRRSGSSLFAELEDWDLGESRVASYQRVLDELRSLDERLHGQSKFWTIARYHLADHLYIAAPLGMIHPRELPIGWGLIELPARVDSPLDLRVSTIGPAHACQPRHRQRLLRNIAVAATRGLHRRIVSRTQPIDNPKRQRTTNRSAILAQNETRQSDRPAS